MKIKLIASIFFMGIILLVGCSNNENSQEETLKSSTPIVEEEDRELREEESKPEDKILEKEDTINNESEEISSNNNQVEEVEGENTEGEYILSISKERKLRESDILGFDGVTLRLARNEIFARHGYVFKTPEMSEYFKSKSWYSPDPNYKGDLNDIERYNVNFIKDFEEKDTSKNAEGIDLNGDGIKDEINFSSDESEFVLEINDSKIEDFGAYLEGNYYIVDIDKEDDYKEILISDWGPSDDYVTFYYYYDGNEIVSMGITEGMYSDSWSNIVIKGNGTIGTSTRGGILHTWFYKDYYKLDSNHKLVHVPQDLYEMTWEVTVKKSIPLLESRDSDKVIAYLEVGEKATILSSDDVSWCFVKKEDGTKGWFEIEGYSKIKGTDYTGEEVFEGLCFAD